MNENTRDPEWLDSADRRRTYDALAASEARYRRLFESARDGILILDVDSGRIVDVNPFLTDLTGYSRDDFIGKHLWEIGPLKDIAASKESFAELQAKEYVRYEDLPLATRDGRSVSVEFVSNVYLVDRQKVIQCNIRDITARLQIEQRLRESEMRYRTIFEDAQDGMALAEAKTGLLIDCNRALCRMVERDKAELVGQLQSILHPTLTGAENGTQTFRQHREGDPGHALEDLLLSRSGKLIPVEIRAASVRMSDRDYRLGVFRDITERKRGEAEREKLEEQLRMSQRMEAIGSLAGGVAHDFNNLLSVILSYTGFAMEGVRDGDPLKNDLLEVKQAGERAAALTRQLLAFSRKQVLQPVALSLNQSAAGVEKMLQRILGEDIDLVQTLAPDLGLTLADPGQIEQVLMNLVVNARDAMPNGGKLAIETSNVEVDEEYAASHVAVTPGSYVRLAVSDTGCGMDEQTRARIFEPFFTTKEKGKGTGLGLSTVYGIVTQSGGHIWVYSELGKGTTFKVYLRREQLAGTRQASKHRMRAQLPTGTETILVVDDDGAVRKAVQRTLEAAGYTVLMAESGAEALLKARQHAGEIHLLLTDVVMPEMSGTVLVAEIAKTGRTLRVLYMSGYTDDTIVHHGVLDEGIHFLSKPFAANELARKVREVLESGAFTPR
jgi:PAS domain S-box-containing protein